MPKWFHLQQSNSVGIVGGRSVFLVGHPRLIPRKWVPAPSIPKIFWDHFLLTPNCFHLQRRNLAWKHTWDRSVCPGISHAPSEGGVPAFPQMFGTRYLRRNGL